MPVEPNTTALVLGSHDADREKRQVALTSVLAAVLLTGLKIVIGLRTGSLGILSEAAHSGLDLVAAVITFWAVRASGRPADPEHTYGHGKIESLSALVETLLLLLTCAWIIYEGIQRLFFKEVHVQAGFWAFLVVVTSIVIDYSRSRALMRVARKHNSQALEADALHFSTDIWSSAVVLLGLIMVLVAQRTGYAWLAHADAVAALGVAAIVIWVSLRLGKRTIDILLDAVPPALRDEISRAAAVSGVLEVRQARVRRAGPDYFVDLTVSVPRDTSLERAHDIAGEAEAAVQSILPTADVMVHVDPAQSEREGIVSTVRRCSARHNLGVHGILIHDVHGRHSLEMHLEAPETLTVGAAHTLASAFEADLRKELPWVEQVWTHLEPFGDHAATLQAAPVVKSEIIRALAALPQEIGHPFDAHHITIRRVGPRLSLSFHCGLDADTVLTEAHAFTHRLEAWLRRTFPDLGRIVIHVEPKAGSGGDGIRCTHAERTAEERT